MAVCLLTGRCSITIIDKSRGNRFLPAGQPQMSASRNSTALRRKLTSFIGRRGRTASVLACCVLFAQLVAAAHVHPWYYSGVVSRGVHPVATDATCAVCVLHVHAPVCAAALPVLPQPSIAQASVACAARSRALCPPQSRLCGRAPPALA